jgi:hypothetical protein
MDLASVISRLHCKSTDLLPSGIAGWMLLQKDTYPIEEGGPQEPLVGVPKKGANAKPQFR